RPRIARGRASFDPPRSAWLLGRAGLRARGRSRRRPRPRAQPDQKGAVMNGGKLVPYRPLAVSLAALALLVTGAVAAWTVAIAQTNHHQQGAEPAAGGWLVKLSPEARTEAIQRQLRGFETTMAEVAYRYTEMYWGGVDGNWDYAAHMQEELRKALELGLERR